MNLTIRLLNLGFKSLFLSISTLIVANIHAPLKAQEIEPTFISISEGLANPNVQDIIQDSYGLIWIATSGGIQNYDGYRFETYKNVPGKPTSLLHNNVWGLLEDHDGSIWAATEKGISRFDRKEKSFTNYDLVEQFNMSERAFFRVFNIVRDSKNRLWATNGINELISYDRQSDTWNVAKYGLDNATDEELHYGVSLAFTEDSDGGLWLGSTRYGLMHRSSTDSVFRPIQLDGNSVDFVEDLNRITSLYADSASVIWITTRNGVYKFYPGDGRVDTIKSYDYNMENRVNHWNSILQDPDGNIWIANNYRGILKFDGISDQFQEISISGSYWLKNTGWDIALTDFIIDKSGIFWFGSTSQGMIKYDPEKKPFVLYTHEEANKQSLSHNGVFGILASQAKPGILYVGTRSAGLDIFNTNTQKFSQITYHAINDFYGGAVRSIGEDDDGTLWLGTWGDGLIELDQNYNEIRRYTYDSKSSNSVSDDKIRVIKKDDTGNFWIGTNNGLNYFNPNTGKFKRIYGEMSRAYSRELIGLVEDLTLTENKVAGIMNVTDFQNLSEPITIEEGGNYLVAYVGEGDISGMADVGWIENAAHDSIWHSFDFHETYYAGGAAKNRMIIDKLSLDPGSYQLRYMADDSHSYNSWNDNPPDQTSLYGIVLIKIPDKKSNLLIESEIQQIQEDLLISGVNIAAIEITDDIIWVGTNPTGLNKINLADNSVKIYLYDSHKDNSLNNNVIYDLYEDEKGDIWITTEGGICRLNPETEQFTRYTEEDGLPTNLTESILSGDNGEMWISTQSGLSQMVVNESLGKVTFINYNADDGLGGDTFLAQAATRTSDGIFYFGGDHGLNAVSKIKANDVPPDLIFTDLLISNTSFYEMEGNSLLDGDLLNQQLIELSHDQNSLSFEFAALHYANPLKNQYAHFLKGYDKDWVYDNRNYASYTNLDPGEYEFSIRASNAYGIWNEDGESIKIIIAPPWHQTWWAYMSYALLFLVFLYGFDRSMRNRLIRRERERSREKELAQAKEIEKAYNKLKSTQTQLLHSEKMASLGELTAGIAHEIQNPLNFVNNFAEVSIDLIEDMQEEMNLGNPDVAREISEDIKQNLDKIYHHGGRASSIVKGMLEHSRTGDQQKSLTDINALAEEYLRLAYHGLRAKDKSFNADFKTDFEDTLPKINVVPQDIGRVILNLINNAFYAVNKKAKSGIKDYKAEVIVSNKKMNGQVEIRVKDNAEGIPPDVLDKIFQPFFTTKPTGQGTGLGLSLSYDIITKGHGGIIKIDTKVGEGTEFIILLPV